MSSPIAEPPDATKGDGEVPARPASPADPVTEGALDPEPATEDEGLAVRPYDAIVVLSFGGPESTEEVMPFLRRVTAGRGVPDERLEAVAEHYYARGGKSPINDQTRALQQALHAELRRRGVATPVLLGNRNSEPFLVDTLRQAQDAGARQVLIVTTSAYASYSSCRQYREDIAAALIELADEDRQLAVDKIRQYATHPSFTRVNARLVTEAVRGCGQPDDDKLRVVFVTHSIPEAMDDTSGPGDGEGNLYEHQHDEIAHVILDEAGITLDRNLSGALVYCSRSGSPSQPWLEPDVNDHLRSLAAQGVTDVVVAPIGFVSDHMEVVHDLDTEAAATAAEVGLKMTRVPTVGTDPEFVMGLADLVEERAAQARGEQVELVGWPGAPMPPICAAGCCPNLRAHKPAACGMD
ncbi:ferrochelatase [Flexivirga meconopsidis]|uniref:ferrochelatase n=1 Tax=Flexivirga meconopsidis TaxID=2977121 RepID=UPI00223F5D85|nr:ferrochelatase [Flexivirga meconopsidis]